MYSIFYLLYLALSLVWLVAVIWCLPWWLLLATLAIAFFGSALGIGE